MADDMETTPRTCLFCSGNADGTLTTTGNRTASIPVCRRCGRIASHLLSAIHGPPVTGATAGGEPFRWRIEMTADDGRGNPDPAGPEKTRGARDGVALFLFTSWICLVALTLMRLIIFD